MPFVCHVVLALCLLVCIRVGLSEIHLFAWLCDVESPLCCTCLCVEVTEIVGHASAVTEATDCRRSAMWQISALSCTVRVTLELH